MKQEAGKGTPYDLAIIDRHMPGMDGLTLALKFANPLIATTRLILSTAEYSASLKNEALAAGFSGFSINRSSNRQALQLHCLDIGGKELEGERQELYGAAPAPEQGAHPASTFSRSTIIP